MLYTPKELPLLLLVIRTTIMFNQVYKLTQNFTCKVEYPRSHDFILQEKVGSDLKLPVLNDEVVDSLRIIGQ